MPKEYLHTNQGFSIIEVLLAGSALALIVTILVGAVIYGQESTTLAGNRTRAAILAEEGLEAVRNIRDGGSGISNLANGAFGLSTTGNQWNLSGLSDVTDIFTRQVIISAVDKKRKLLTSNVTWQQNPQRTGLVSLSSYLTAWQCADQATLLSVNASGATLGSPNRNLVGITVQNTGVGCGDIIIDKITVSWIPTTGNRQIQNILINNVSMWAGNATTGTELDISNSVLAEESAAQSTEYQFNNPMNNRAFAIVFIMADSSAKTVSGISPL